MSQALEVTASNFDTEVAQSEIPVLVDFWAAWCGPCRMLAPTVDKIAETYAGKVKVCKCNVDEAPDLASRFGIRSIPALLVFKGGERVAQEVGAISESDLSKMLDGALAR